MADVDTSSYPKPAALPVQKSLLDNVQQWQGVESGKLTIDKQKLDNTNQALGYMTRAMGSLGPNATKEEYLAVGQNAVKMGLVPPQMLQTYEERLVKAPTAGAFYNEFITSAAEHQKQLDYHLGTPGVMSLGDRAQPIRTSQQPGFGIRSAGQPIAVQQSPDTTTYGPDNRPVYKGPTPGLPEGPPPLPVERPAAVPARSGAAAMPSAGPLTDPAIPGPSRNFGGNVVSAVAEAPTVADRFSGLPAGPDPMFEEGKKKISADQETATQRATAIKPAQQALKLLPGLATGPGTDQWNKAIAFMKANNIITTAAENDPTAIYQEVSKKLAQYVASSPAGQRSDAAQTLAEAASPSPKTQISPALIKLTRDALALDRVQIARPTAFEDKNVGNYGKHQATFPQSIDERAFGLADLPKKEQTALTDKMYKKYEKDPRNPEALKFFKSLDLAKKQGFFYDNSDEE